MKARDIAFWGVLDDLHDAIGLHHGVVHQVCAPSVAVCYAVTKDRIAFDELSNINAIAQEYRIAGMDSCTSHTSSTSNGGRAKAFATREGKEYCSQAQCQDENR